MDKSIHRRFALCAEFGGGQWRMIQFFPMKEIRVPPFLSAQSGKWFEQMEDGEFRLVDGKCENINEIEVKMDGLEEHICLKIRLPVSFLPSTQNFGFPLNHFSAESKQKFISSIDPAITGDVLFDFIPPNGEHYFAAFVSLTSFNAPIGNGQPLQWSIRSFSDILGPWDKLLPNSPSPTSLPNELMDSNCSGECPRFGPRGRRQVPEEERHRALMVCWKKTVEDSFFLEYDLDPGRGSPITRLQSNNKILEIETELGGWYSIEYSKYSKSVHIYVHQIVRAKEEEKLVETRLEDGQIQFKVAIQRGLDGGGFESCLGAVKIKNVPKELGEKKETLMVWCMLSRRLVMGRNYLEFSEECGNESAKQFEQKKRGMEATEEEENTPKSPLDSLAISPPIQIDSMPDSGFGKGRRRRNGNPIDGNEEQKMAKENIPQSPHLIERGGTNVKEKEYEDEVPIPDEKMRNVILAHVECGSACRVEKSNESTNSIRVVGPSRKLVKECTQRVRELRRKIMMEDVEEGREILVENGNGMKEGNWQQAEMAEEAIEPMEKGGNVAENGPQKLTNIFGQSKQRENYCETIEKRRRQMSDEMSIEVKPSPSPSPRIAKRSQNALPLSASDSALKIHQLSIKVPKKYHGCVVGKDATNLDWMRGKFNVTIELPSELSISEEVRITGICANDVNKCKQHILAMVKRMEGEQSGQIAVPTRIIPLIVGKDGNKMRKLREQFPNVAIEGPYRREENGWIQFRGQKEQVKELRIHLVDWISELQEKHQEEMVEVPMDHPNHSPAQFLRFIRGTNCEKIRNLSKRFPAVKIDFPIPKDGEPPLMVVLDGPMEDTGKVKKTLEKSIEELKTLADIYIPVEEKHFEKFLRIEAKLLKEIKEEHPKCQIYLNKEKGQMEIRGKSMNAENAQKRILEILAEMEEIMRYISIHPTQIWALSGHFPEIREKFSVKCKTFPDKIQLIGRSVADLNAAEDELMALLPVTKQQEVPIEYRRKLMMNKAEKMKQMEKEHNVQIYASKEGQLNAQLEITGSVGNVDACMAAIQAEMPVNVNQKIKIPREFRGTFIGRGGELVRQMGSKHSVNIHFSENIEEVIISGVPKCVDECANEYREKVAQMEKEKQLKSFKLSLLIPLDMRGKLIGTDGRNVRELETRFGVKIVFGDDNYRIDVWQCGVDIIGIEEQCRRCEAEIRRRVNAGSNQLNGVSSRPNSNSNIRRTPLQKTQPPQRKSSPNDSGGCILM